MSRTVFFDTVSPLPYDSRSFGERAVQGTEASVIRIADAVGAWVMQHNRSSAWERYLPLQALPGIEHVVVIRDSRALAQARDLFPDARLHLWLHDKMRPATKRGRRLRADAALLRQARCPSSASRTRIGAMCSTPCTGPASQACRCARATTRSIRPCNPTARRSMSASWCSSLLRTRDWRSRWMPSARCAGQCRTCAWWSAIPATRPTPCASLAGVQFLGPQPQPAMHAQVRRSLCAFQPNFRIPETFGLVYAEAHALGTPVLTHDFGAAAEVVGDPRQVLAVKHSYRCYEALVGRLQPRWRMLPARLADAAGLFDVYVDRIREWRAGARPEVRPDPRFALSALAAQWRELLGP